MHTVIFLIYSKLYIIKLYENRISVNLLVPNKRVSRIPVNYVLSRDVVSPPSGISTQTVHETQTVTLIYNRNVQIYDSTCSQVHSVITHSDSRFVRLLYADL